MKTFISFREALELTLAHVHPGEPHHLSLDRLTGRILAADVAAAVDCPSVSTSRKDGYAVCSADLVHASAQNPVTLTVVGQLGAGDACKLAIEPGQTVRITTGAPLPEGADAVLSEEFSRRDENRIVAFNTAASGPGGPAGGRRVG